MNKKLTFKETGNMVDEAAVAEYMKKNNMGAIRRGHVKIFADNGECILEKDNLIVLRGRTFSLEKIFNYSSGESIDGTYNTSNLADKKVGIFVCGSGGCHDNNVFEVIPDIESNTKSLRKPIPFRLVEDLEKDPELQKQYVYKKEYNDGLGIPFEEESITYDEEGNKIIQPIPTQKLPLAYYGKKFKILGMGKSELDKEKGIDIEDEVYIKLELEIDTDDFKTIRDIDEQGNIVTRRATAISEIGLCITDENYSDDSIELFSKINFPSEPMANPSKTLTIHYYIYA